ncbi:zinc metallopeptidase [Proteiniclasticum sp. QWL-01]|uniref:zinc metallopeptidase n=1 Tax=Proteiniclasticum sp. QWL-01 TaxID=3036945 RepID=UPI0024118650|nr:zinc metallopeptidase [Proteiniclasticum sp. QWL-01]WFF74222.1 zinc metallopeptidase [Proteiniclasticum sp. QWL-01]
MTIISAIAAMIPYMDSTMLILIPGILLAAWAQSKVTSTYQQFSRVGNQRGLTGAQVARYILDNSGLNNITIEPIRGQLTDHYDPKGKVLRLSEGVYGSQSVAALGIASHEVGHAIQDATNYGPMRLRGAIVPLAAIGGNLSMVLVLAGLFLGGTGLVQIGAFLFLFTVLFQLVTLPVEFDASKRALRILDTGILTPTEVEGAKRVLNAAALTYVAAAVTGILSFLRILLLSRRRD